MIEWIDSDLQQSHINSTHCKHWLFPCFHGPNSLGGDVWNYARGLVTAVSISGSIETVHNDQVAGLLQRSINWSYSPQNAWGVFNQGFFSITEGFFVSLFFCQVQYLKYFPTVVGSFPICRSSGECGRLSDMGLPVTALRQLSCVFL